MDKKIESKSLYRYFKTLNFKFELAKAGVIYQYNIISSWVLSQNQVLTLITKLT